MTSSPQDGLVVELPPIIWQNVVCDHADALGSRSVRVDVLARAAIDLGCFLLDEFEAPNFRRLATWACLAVCQRLATGGLPDVA